MKKYILFLIVFFGVLFFAKDSWAADHYIRQGAAGANNGSDWTNAWIQLPGSLTRGDTYYIADGSYGFHQFSDPESGTQVITIKKAIPSDHGTNTGWQDSYGDGQALFTGYDKAWSILSDYYVFDGQIGDGKSAHGFDLTVTKTPGTEVIILGWEGMGIADHVKLSHVGAYQQGFSACEGTHTENTMNAIVKIGYGGNDITFSDCYFRNTCWGATFTLVGPSNLVIDNCYIENAYFKEAISARRTNDVTVKNTVWHNTAGTAAIAFEQSSNWNIYNNLFYTDNTDYVYTDCIICDWSGAIANNIKIYGNTFANLGQPSKITFFSGSGSEVYNNIFYGPNGITLGSNLTHDYNLCYGGNCSSVTSEAHGAVGSAGMFIGPASGNFHLSGPTAAGISLSSPFNIDMDGNTRGADGTWDIGAYEYGGSGPTTYTLTIAKAGTGSGTVSGTGISCGSDCTETVNSGTSITLTASANSGSTFAGWSGGGCSGTGNCTVTVTSNLTVTATFNLTTDTTPPAAPTGVRVE